MRKAEISHKTWGGRFKEKTDEALDRFNASIAFDRRLYAQDIEGSKAHCRMLAKQGIITKAEASKILHGLAEIREVLDKGGFDESYEDIHTLVEKALVDRVGPVGEKLHTGRSRNDQVALDVRLYVRDAIGRVDGFIRDMQRALVILAEKNSNVIMPGYTHLQRAQPVLLSHHLLAYYQMLKRDRQRFAETLKRVNVLPLGSAALAGSTFDLDREMVARELGFNAISENSLDAVSDRDFVLEFLFASSVVMMHLSRLSEELVIWATREFEFVFLPDAFCTGSSIMPQKKNPDLMELVRAKTGRVYGHLVALLTMMKGLPLAYNKDMQEDKPPVFDATDTLKQSLQIFSEMIGTMTVKKENMASAAKTGFLNATDAADYLVLKGLPFRDCHEVIGKLVLHCIREGKALEELSLPELQQFSPLFQEDVYEKLTMENCINNKRSAGSTSFDSVEKQISDIRKNMV